MQLVTIDWVIIGGFFAVEFAIGFFLYGETGSAIILSVIAVASMPALFAFWSKVCGKEAAENQ